jgi:lipopolysaccharide export system protein LptA
MDASCRNPRRDASIPRTLRRVAPRGARVAALAALLLACGNARAADPAARNAPVQVDAASSSVDYRTSTVVFRDVVITQGTVRVSAEQARATGLEFQKSTWTFNGNVRIAVDGGGLRSDQATVYFLDSRVSRATIVGAPAEFEQQRTGSSDMARGRAGNIEYDLDTGAVRLRGAAWLTDGRNEISGEELVYDLRAQRVQSESRPGAQDRVRITIRPKDAAEAVAPKP